jgi:hypothetical protein
MLDSCVQDQSYTSRSTTRTVVPGFLYLTSEELAAEALDLATLQVTFQLTNLLAGFLPALGFPFLLLLAEIIESWPIDRMVILEFHISSRSSD